MASLKTLNNFLSALPNMERVLFHIANIFGQRERFKIQIVGHGAVHVRLFFGLVDYRKGPIFELDLRCTSAAMQILQRGLLKQSLKTQAVMVAK